MVFVAGVEKVLLAGFSMIDDDRTCAETRATSSPVSHPGIVPLYDPFSEMVALNGAFYPSVSRPDLSQTASLTKSQCNPASVVTAGTP